MGNVCSRRSRGEKRIGEELVEEDVMEGGDADDLTAPILVPLSHTVSEDDMQALYEWARRGNLAEVRELLTKGVGPDAHLAYDGGSALTIAARGGHGDMVRLLLGSRADLTTHTDDGSSALMHAVSGARESAAGSLRAVQALLMGKADPSECNDDGVTPLMMAAQQGSLEVAKQLVAAGAELTTVADEWGSAVDAAGDGGHKAVADYLISAGAMAANSDKPPATSERRVAAGEKWGYDAFDGYTEMESDVRYTEMESDDDTIVIDWIGKNRSRQSGFFVLSPVYGGSWVQLAYGFMLLGLIAAQIFYAVIGTGDAAAALARFALPTDLLVGIYVLPIFSILSFLEFIMARQLLKAEQLVELLSTHFEAGDDLLKSSSSLRLPMQGQGSSKCLAPNSPSHLQKALISKGVPWMRKALDPSQTKVFVRAMIVIFNLSIPSFGLVFFSVCKYFGVSSSFFICTLMPLLAAWLFHLIADTTIFVMAQFCKYRVKVMQSDFESIMENDEAQKGQFLSIMRDYIDMDEQLSAISSQVTNLLFLSTSGIALMCWYCFAVALQALALNVTIFLIMASCTAGLLFLLMFLLYPLAQVTDLATSRTSLGKSSSLIVSIHKSGLLEMTSEVHGEYMRLLNLMMSCPIGFKMPIIGLLRTSDLATYAKTLAALFPTLVTTAINFRHRDKP